jgi:hypothetical protein
MKIRLVIVGVLSAALIWAYVNDKIPLLWLEKGDQLFRSGLALMENDNFRDAATKLEQSKDLAKENASFFYNLFVCYEKLKEDDSLTDAQRQDLDTKSEDAVTRYLELKAKEDKSGVFAEVPKPKVTERGTIGAAPTPMPEATAEATPKDAVDVPEYEKHDPAVGKALIGVGTRYAGKARKATDLARQSLDDNDLIRAGEGLQFALEYGRMANQAASKAAFHVPKDSELTSLKSDLATLDADIKQLWHDYKAKRDAS